MDKKFVYRYRPTDSLLGKYEELNKQEIFFSNTEKLNDPLEGIIVPFYK